MSITKDTYISANFGWIRRLSRTKPKATVPAVPNMGAIAHAAGPVNAAAAVAKPRLKRSSVESRARRAALFAVPTMHLSVSWAWDWLCKRYKDTSNSLAARELDSRWEISGNQENGLPFPLLLPSANVLFPGCRFSPYPLRSDARPVVKQQTDRCLGPTIASMRGTKRNAPALEE